jgi:hypothetical protein
MVNLKNRLATLMREFTWSATGMMTVSLRRRKFLSKIATVLALLMFRLNYYEAKRTICFQSVFRKRRYRSNGAQCLALFTENNSQHRVE